MAEDIAPFTIKRCSGQCVLDRPDPIPGGLGVRLPIVRSGRRLSFSVVTSGNHNTIPPWNNVLGEIGANYLYGGFSGSAANGAAVISDMGLIHQRLAGRNQFAWKPFFRVTHGNRSFSFSPTLPNNTFPTIQGEVWHSNGYRMGSTVAIEVRIDPSPNGANYSRVVLRTEGFAYHNNLHGGGGQIHLTQLVFADMPRINNPSNWRLLAHPAIESRFGNNNDHLIDRALVSGTFNNIRVDGVLPTFNQSQRDYGFALATEAERARGTFFLQSCKGI